MPAHCKGASGFEIHPDSLTGETLGGRLGDAVQQGTMAGLQTVANEALSRGVGLLSAAVGAALG